MRINNDNLIVNTQKKWNDTVRLIERTLLDCQLKVMLHSIPLRNGSASDVIQIFTANPLEFTQTHVIRSDFIARLEQLPTRGRTQFVARETNGYDIEFVYNLLEQNDRLSVGAYFLGCNSSDQSAKTPAYVDIPVNAPENNFLFTSSFTEGSIVVTKLNETTYRVYHDVRVNSSLLYDNVVMAIDHSDYGISSIGDTLAMAYMRFQDGQWQLILQRQKYEVIDGTLKTVLRTDTESVSILYADSQWSGNNQQIFLAYREDIHQKLTQLASYFGIDSEGIIDGVYIEGEFSLKNPAILPWLDFKDKINQCYEKKLHLLIIILIKLKMN